MFFCKAGLEIGEMILAVNKDSLLGSNYDTVNIILLFLFVHTVCLCVVTSKKKSDSKLYNKTPLQAANLLKRTEGLVTLVVSNPGKRASTPTPPAATEAEKNAVNKPALKPTGPPSRPTTPTPGAYK